jgi:starch synthase (maltosyl-transferring)
MIIYNLFPLLAGPFSGWDSHFERAADMGFDTVFVNPIQRPGSSGSLYSVADYRRYHPLLIDPAREGDPELQVREMTEKAKRRGLDLMIDLVVNHCAFDSDLPKAHPAWFRQRKGKLVHPSCKEGDRTVVWGDLVQFDHRRSADKEGLFRYFLEIVVHLVDLGFRGFRCDAAYQVPQTFWRRLIREVKSAQPDTIFAAETLGCTPQQTRNTAQAGFDFIFNSAKWWDFTAPWLIDQYEMTRPITPSIAFPESHDTERLATTLHGDVEGTKQRYLFAALFSAGVLMPVGFEFGFKQQLHVVVTRPTDWETTGIDLRPFIAAVNRIKRAFPIFGSDCPTSLLPFENPNLLLLKKTAPDGSGEALLILNKDLTRHQDFWADHLGHYFQAGSMPRDVSPEYPLDPLPSPYHYALRPGQGIVLVASACGADSPLCAQS